MRTIDIEAAVCIVASDQVWRNPGERWACPADEAEGLIASGAAVAVGEANPTPDTPGPSRPAAARDTIVISGPSLSTIQVSGIGPSTRDALAQAGVRTLGDLAKLTDEEIAGLALDENLRRRIRDDWRGQAAELLDAGEAPS